MNARLIFNIAISGSAVLILLILLLTTIFVGGLKRATDKYLAALIFSYFITAALSFVLYTYRCFGDKYNLIAIKVLYGFILTFIYSSGYLTFEYCFHYFRTPTPRFKRFIRPSVQIYCIIVGILGLLGLIFGWLFTLEDNRFRVNSTFIIIYVAFALLSLLSLVICFYKTKTSKLESISFLFLTAGIPLVLFFDYFFSDSGIYCASLISFFLIHFLLYYVEKGKRINEQEKSLHEQKTRLMISQIQPHFIYNCLSSISYLCKKDGEKASEAINDFSNYLRLNFSSINDDKLVPFEKELEYIETYLKLEKLRFGDRVNVVYDLKVKDFYIPFLVSSH